jgi:hypothetical protein
MSNIQRSKVSLPDNRKLVPDMNFCMQSWDESFVPN